MITRSKKKRQLKKNFLESRPRSQKVIPVKNNFSLTFPKSFPKTMTNKNGIRFVSKSFSRPLSWQHKQNMHFLKEFLWFFTHKVWVPWREEDIEKNIALSMEYVKAHWHDFKDLKKELNIKNLNFSSRTVLKKYLREYLTDYFQEFHKEDWARLKMKLFKEKYADKLPKLFVPPWKKSLLPPTKIQRWLTTTYSQYQKLRFKDRLDFFRTYIGHIMGTAYWEKPGWQVATHIYPVTQTYYSFHVSHKRSWWYDNLAQKKPTPRSAKRFILDRPKTAFQVHWTQQKLEPWRNSLLFKRALYSGFGEDYRKENKFQVLKMKHYLRSKNPRQEKRNRLYQRANFLLNNFRQRSRVRADKVARIKQVTAKIWSPFYGHLKSHQIKRLVKKSRKISSPVLSSNEILLNHFENRLDVVVYRLNLAPSILWARRLVKAGLVFVIPQQSSLFWDSMHCGLKKLSFPLSLRDPKNLYAKTAWTYIQENWIEFKFLGQPKKNISYLLQPGDLIQCAAGTSLNHFKTKSWLCRKPIPNHLMLQQKKKYVWHWPTQKFRQQSFKNWEQNSAPVYAAMFLHAPQYRDLDSKDRVKESFLRWFIL